MALRQRDALQGGVVAVYGLLLFVNGNL